MIAQNSCFLFATEQRKKRTFEEYTKTRVGASISAFAWPLRARVLPNADGLRPPIPTRTRTPPARYGYGRTPPSPCHASVPAEPSGRALHAALVRRASNKASSSRSPCYRLLFLQVDTARSPVITNHNNRVTTTIYHHKSQ